MTAATVDRPPGTWQAEVVDVVRAASGGLLFGVPLLYTMEVWWVGSHTHPRQMLVVLGLLSVPLLILNTTAGFRAERDVRFVDAVVDTIESLAIGLVVTAVVLVLIQEVRVDEPIELALGKVIYEAVPFCLGIGVARHFLRGRRDGLGDEDEQDGSGSTGQDGRADGRHATTPLADLGGAAVGAVFVALSIAPTDEVPMITSALSPPWVLALIAASLVSSYGIVFVAEFVGQQDRHAQEGAFQRPITETVTSYLIALAVAALLLWLFQRDAEVSLDFLDRTIVLGFPAAIGGAAGRLAL